MVTPTHTHRGRMKALASAHIRNVAGEQVVSNEQQGLLQLASEAGGSGELASR